MEAIKQSAAKKTAISAGPLFHIFQLRVHSVWWLLAAVCLGALIYCTVPNEYSARSALHLQTTSEIRLTLAVTAGIMLLWCTRPIPIFLTSLLPLVFFPLFGVLPLNKVLPSYASEFAFSVGSFLILASALHRWNLDRRIALWIIYLFGPKKSHVLWGTILLATFSSMWVPNGELAAILLPVASALCTLVDEKSSSDAFFNFRTLLFCGLCASLCIGGMTMISGSPINSALVSFIRSAYETRIGHLLWLMIGIPIFTVALPFLCLTVSRLLSHEDRSPESLNEYFIQHEIDTMPSMKTQELLILITVALALLACVTSTILLSTSAELRKTYGFFTHSFIGICAVIFLYSARVGKSDDQRLLTLRDLEGCPWWVLLYLGCSLALVQALKSSGALAFLTSFVVPVSNLSPVLAVLAVSLVVFFMTNFFPTAAAAGIMVAFFKAISATGGIFSENLVIIGALVASASFLFPMGSVAGMFFYSAGHFSFRLLFRFGLIISCVTVPICIIVPIVTSFFLYEEAKFEAGAAAAVRSEAHDPWQQGRIMRFYNRFFYSGPHIRYEE
jgi:sodium-dependent dicarboxylate transporter 2/3/5